MSENNSKDKIFILDGGLGSQLEDEGVGNTYLWSAELLLSNPDRLRQIHTLYYEAGADIVTTASYQASVEGIVRRCKETGRPDTEEQALKFIASSVGIAKQARDEFWDKYEGSLSESQIQRQKPFVAASVGPYGAFLAQGEEYTGNYGGKTTYQTLREFHDSRLCALVSATPDFIAFETMPNFLEIKVLRDIIDSIDNCPPFWISFSVGKTKDTIADGTPLGECLETLFSSSKAKSLCAAVGVNCLSPSSVSHYLTNIKTWLDKNWDGEAAQPRLVAYPNSGEIYDGVAKTWSGSTSASIMDYLDEWYDIGARYIGGCCRTTPKDIALIRSHFDLKTKKAI